ncbi:glycosyltransferase [Thermobifida alba]|uniref:glycosyltransferase n=1 Tax=Thermobifida alba TaxID=53522 RepID=UPI003380AE46
MTQLGDRPPTPAAAARGAAPRRTLRILLWHVHGSWTTSFVHGGHVCLLPVTPDRGPDGRGRAATWTWPDNAVEVPWERLRDTDVDLVLAQRPHELDLAERLLGRRIGRDLPAVYVEHNTPRGDVPHTRHPLADRDDVTIVHVTHFNALFWDNGRAPVAVVEHGVADPGHRYTGRRARAGAVVNEPLRRWRTTGTDLLPRIARSAPLDLFGMGVADAPARLGLPPDLLRVHEDLPQHAMHERLAHCRAYVHPVRWTSLGLSLIEAMMLGLPVAVLGTTEAHEAVPPEAGVVTTRIDRLCAALRDFLADPGLARATGAAARAAALRRYGLARFHSDWDRLLQEVTR